MPGDVYTVYAFDITQNSLICELPANSLTFDSKLNDVGAVGFTINLLDPAAAAQAAPFLQYVTNSVPVALYIDRDGTLVWGGYQTTLNYQHTAHTLAVQGKEWLGFWAQRLIAQQYDSSMYPNGVDPAALIQTAIAGAQSSSLCGPGAYIGIGVTGGSSSIPYVKPSYTLGQTFVSQVIADCVAGITPGTGGIDLSTAVQWNPNTLPAATPQVIHYIESPRAGRTWGVSQFSIDLLSAVDFTWPTDYGQACTTLYETGAGSGQVANTAVVTTDVPVGGLGQWPRVDKVIQHSNVLSPEWLAQLAAGDAQEYAGGIVTPTVTLRTADAVNPLGSWIVGDDCRLFAEPFELYPSGIDQTWRVVMHQVTVPDDGVPTVTLTFNPPPQF